LIWRQAARTGPRSGGFGPELDKSDAEVRPAVAGWWRAQNLGWPATQAFQLFAHESAAIVLFECKPDFDFPSSAPQGLGGHERIACVMALSGENDACSGAREKFGDCSCDARACLIHQRFDFYSSREGRFFCASHLRRS
jgi:hypothetical protein